MPTTLIDKPRRVLVVDDESTPRQQFGELLDDMGIQPIYPPGPLGGVDDSFDQWQGKVDALVCDYQLRLRSYAHFTGDKLVASFNRHGLPAILCTTYTDGEMMVSRTNRRHVPVLLQPSDYNEDRILWGFDRCQREFRGDYDRTRRPWRAQVRVIDSIDDGYFHVVVSGWKPDMKLRVYHEDVPDALRSKIWPGQRLHAQINTGAETAADLYFFDWEID